VGESRPTRLISSKMSTKSELVFERYCTERGYQAERIRPQADAGRFPDYRLATPAGSVIVEIKEFNANDADIRFAETLERYGHASDRRSLGKRVFNAIRDSASQLRRYKDTAFPEVLLLYENIEVEGWPFGRNEYLRTHDMAAGMFGSLTVRVWLDSSEKPVNENDATYGGGRQMTNRERLYIGAVAILNEATERSPIQIDFFHNPFSTKPVRPRYFPHPDDRHFVKTGHPDVVGWDWAEFVGDRHST
jgi:hypothetical protein